MAPATARQKQKRKAVQTVARAAAGRRPGKSDPDSKEAKFPGLVDPKSLGLDPKLIRDYEVAMQRVVQKGITPGCGSIVFVDGQIVQAGSWGFADVEGRTPFRLDTLCRLYCTTKSYVAVTFMSLVDEGRASLEDRLDKYLPDFAKTPVNSPKGLVLPKSPILLKHLLSHTSGIDYPPDLGTDPRGPLEENYLQLQGRVQRGTVRKLETFVRELARKGALSCHPGKGYYYGYSMDVLARVVEIIMGKPLDKCLRERVFDPLDMQDTLWAAPESDLHRLAAIYGSATTWEQLYGGQGKAKVTTKGGLCRIDGNRPSDSHWREGQQCKVLSGGGFMGYLYGGLVSTVADTAKFVKMLLDRGVTPKGHRILKAKTVELMERDRLKDSWGAGRACYIGNKGVFREADEYGMGGAACTWWSVDRDDGVAAIWFTQNIDLPEFEDMKGVDPKKSNLWAVMHTAVQKAGARKRRSTTENSRPAKRRAPSK